MMRIHGHVSMRARARARTRGPILRRLHRALQPDGLKFRDRFAWIVRGAHRSDHGEVDDPEGKDPAQVAGVDAPDRDCGEGRCERDASGTFG